MCGIAGFTHKNCAVDERVIRRVTASLIHRGPDQQGVFESRAVSIGSVRLKVIDLDGGDQPFKSDDGDAVVVFNGEIYNHRSLREDLRRLGHRFHTDCDTEVVLHAFIEWDTLCFRRFRGMFAVAILSESGKRLVLARDRAGIKPLYLYSGSQNLYFGSEIKAILEHEEVERVLDKVALQEYLSFNYIPSERTLFEGISKLPPGHLLEWFDGDLRMERWWKLDVSIRPDLSLDAAKEELDFLLLDAVREQLVSDVPVGIWASGGLDSSAILHYASQSSSQRLKTFSVSFDEASCDERSYFRELASIYGTEHHEYHLTADSSIASAIEEFAWHSDDPCADAGALPVWFLSQASRKHVTVALSGDGADELFGGYITYQADNWARFLRRVPVQLRQGFARALNGCLPVSDRKISFEYKLKRWIEGSFLPPDEAHFFWNGAFSGEQRRLLAPAEAPISFAELIGSMPDAKDLSRYLLMDQSCYLPADILHKLDRMSMAHALEVRPPYLDHRIVEFAASLPMKLKVRGFALKRVLRELMRGKLPDPIVNRKKMGFDIPAHQWFRGPLRQMLFDVLSPEAVESTGIFDSDFVQRLILDHMERRTNAGYQLWGMMTLMVWLKKWDVQVPAREAVPYPHTLAAIT
ncbi:MAG: asparagine synthase (glutamine-hydrolyzing) [Blastocatellia bacterium]